MVQEVLHPAPWILVDPRCIKTPFDLASASGHVGIVRILLATWLVGVLGLQGLRVVGLRGGGIRRKVYSMVGTAYMRDRMQAPNPQGPKC